MTIKQWISPDDVVADALLNPGDRVEALMETGETLNLFYGDLTSDDQDHWRGFYDDDGEEVFISDIRLVHPLP